jgi:hypothetical protein
MRDDFTKNIPSQTAFAFIHNRVFGTDALHIRTKNTVGARSAQWSLVNIGRRWTILRTVAPDLAQTAARPRGSPIAYGRESVRTQSTILCKSKPTLSLLLCV